MPETAEAKSTAEIVFLFPVTCVFHRDIIKHSSKNAGKSCGSYLSVCGMCACFIGTH